MKKKVISTLIGCIVLLTLVLTSFIGCLGGKGDPNTLTIWCQSSDLENIAKQYFAKEYPQYKLNVTVMPTQDLQKNIDLALSN